MDHNDREDIDRGEWRKYNPYNPYVENKKEGPTKLQELDDLFADDTTKEEKTEEAKKETPLGIEDDFSGTLPMGDTSTSTIGKTNSNDTEPIDIQKELEAKFDELFGSLNSTDE